MKFYILIAFILTFANVFPKDNKGVLDDFIKALLIDCESGFVFFGSKPACFIYIPQEGYQSCPNSSMQEQMVVLRRGCEWWLSAGPQQNEDSYVLKISKQVEGKYSGMYEILCLNKKEILSVVHENLSLFQDVLGSLVTPDLLFEKLVKNKSSFYEALNYDNVLVGILLGFGTVNSILGSRYEELELDDPLLPYVPIQKEAQLDDEITHWYIAKSSVFANKEQAPFVKKQKLIPLFGFLSLNDEYKYYLESCQLCSKQLTSYSPKLYFGTFKLDPIAPKLIEKYESEQRKLISMIQKDDLDLTDLVLKKLNLKFVNPNIDMEVPKLQIGDLINAIRRNLSDWEFDIKQTLIEIIQQQNQRKNQISDEFDNGMFVELWVLNKLQNKIETVQSLHDVIENDSSYTKLNSDVFIKTLKKGSPNLLNSDNSSSIFSYTIYPAERSSHLPFVSKYYEKMNLNEVIPGLSVGVQGMGEGELREIIIFPESAYGLFTTFHPWQPLKVVIRLEKKILGSEELKIQPKPILPKRPLLLSSEERIKLKKLEKFKVSQELAVLWEFYKKLADFKTDDLIEWIDINWDKPLEINTLSLDQHIIKFWRNQLAQEREDASKSFVKIPNLVSLVKDRLYIKLINKGDEKHNWPRKITLIERNSEGQLESTEYSNLTYDEFLCWPKGLQLGLKERSIGETGTLYIHPDLSNPALFFNSKAHQKVILDFEISHPE